MKRRAQSTPVHTKPGMLLEALDLEDCLIYPLSYRVLGLFWPLTFF